MKDSLQNYGFDELDRTILRELQNNARITNADLARKIHLSQPAVYNRIKRLERHGVIRQYVALLDREVVGYDLLCFLQIRISGHSAGQIQHFNQTVCEMPEVLECHRVTGDYDILLKIAVRDRQHLDKFINHELGKLPNIERAQTHIVMAEVKSTTSLPLSSA